MITYTRERYPEGYLGEGILLYQCAWEECVELQCSSKIRWVTHTMRSVASDERIELCVKDNDKVVGGLVLHGEYDPHVGYCMYVVFQYVASSYRNRGIARKLFKMALEETRRQGLPVLAYTHRLGDWEYKTTYRKV